MQNYDTLRISIQERNDSAAEAHKIANVKIKRAKLLKHQNDIEENLNTSLQIHQNNDTLDLSVIPASLPSPILSIPSSNITSGHLKPIKQREHEFDRILKDG